jgi:hypothetical protein
MQEDENVIEFSFDIEPFQLDSNIEFTSSEVQYSQNYIDILGDIVEPLPLRIPSIVKPYNEDHDEKTKIQATSKCLKRVKHRKNRKQLLIMFFLLGQLLDETSLSTRELSNLNISKHTRRVALRLFHLYEWVGGEQILRSTKLNVRKLLLLSPPEYEQLIEDSKFAGAQS